MIATVYEIAQRLLPRRVFSSAHRRYHAFQSARDDRRRANIVRKFHAAYGTRVIQGPFAGLKYLEQAAGSEYLPKLLGTYESELHPIIEEIIDRRYQTIIDVGCAEGYYAVGFAYRCVGTKVIAYDIDPAARSLCAAMAGLNRVDDRLAVHGKFEGVSEVAAGQQPILIMLDCEGAEVEILQHQLTETMRCSADFLIEAHDFLDAEITPRIIQLLGKTHSIKLIDSRLRDVREIAPLWFLSNPRDRNLAVNERRFPMQWVYAKSRIE